MEQKIRKGQSEGPVGADADPRRAWPGRQKEMHPVAVLTGNEHYLAWVQQVAARRAWWIAELASTPIEPNVYSTEWKPRIRTEAP